MVNFIMILDSPNMRCRNMSLPTKDFDTSDNRDILVLPEESVMEKGQGGGVELLDIVHLSTFIVGRIQPLPYIDISSTISNIIADVRCCL